jgi:hypothetical protein
VTTNDLADPLEAIPVETTTTNPLTTAVAWIAVVAAVAFIGFWAWTRWIDPPVGGTIDQYVAKTRGQIFADPGAGFRVTTPTKWHVTLGQNPSGQIVTVTDRVGDYQFEVTKTPQPATTIDNYSVALNTLAGQLAAGSNAEIVKQSKPIVLGDFVFKSVDYRRGETNWHAWLELTKDRMYTILARLPNTDQAPFKRFSESFAILGPR